MAANGTVLIDNFESVYQSLQSLERGIQALADVANDWCEEDAKQALVQLLSENLTKQMQQHQQALFGSLARLEPSAA